MEGTDDQWLLVEKIGGFLKMVDFVPENFCEEGGSQWLEVPETLHLGGEDFGQISLGKI